MRMCIDRLEKQQYAPAAAWIFETHVGVGKRSAGHEYGECSLKQLMKVPMYLAQLCVLATCASITFCLRAEPTVWCNLISSRSS